jgi:hypothetical protein
MVKERRAPTSEANNVGKIKALFKQPKAAMWEKGMKKGGRTRIPSGKKTCLCRQKGLEME